MFAFSFRSDLFRERHSTSFLTSNYTKQTLNSQESTKSQYQPFSIAYWSRLNFSVPARLSIVAIVSYDFTRGISLPWRVYMTAQYTFRYKIIDTVQNLKEISGLFLLTTQLQHDYHRSKWLSSQRRLGPGINNDNVPPRRHTPPLF